MRDSVEKYRAFIRGSAAGKESPAVRSRAKLLEIQAARAPLSLKREEARLIDAASLESDLVALVKISRNAMLAIPSRIGAALPHLTRSDIERIDAVVRNHLTGLATADPSALIEELAAAEAAGAKRGRSKSHLLPAPDQVGGRLRTPS